MRENGGIRILENEQGHRLTPSIVSFEQSGGANKEGFLVGDAAKNVARGLSHRCGILLCYARGWWSQVHKLWLPLRCLCVCARSFSV